MLQLGMSDEVTAPGFFRLIDISLETLSDLTAQGILVEGVTPGSYRLEPSIRQYCQHLRERSQSSGDAMVRKASSGQAKAGRPNSLVMKSRDEPPADIDTQQKTRPRSPYLLFGLTIGNIRSFRIYIGEGGAYTVYDT